MPVKITSEEKHLGLVHDNGHMTESDFIASQNRFRDFFLVNGNEPPTSRSGWMLYDDLEALANQMTGETRRFLVIHFGMDQSTLRYGFSFVAGDEQPQSPGTPARYAYRGWKDYPDKMLVGNTLQDVTAAQWRSMRDTYKIHMRVDREGDGRFTRLADNDALRVILPWESEVSTMYRHNARFPAETYRLIIDSVSQYHDDSHTDGTLHSPLGHRHGVAFYMQYHDNGRWHRMLDDDIDEVVIYRNKAADYGNMCPVRCNYYQQRTTPA